MGGKLFLFKGEVDVEKRFDMEEDWCKYFFSSIRRWNPKEGAKERMIWVRCIRVPIHAWTVEFFRFLAEKIRVFIKVDDKTLNIERLDFGRVLIATSQWSNVEVNQRVLIEDLIFDLRILEEEPRTLCFHLAVAGLNTGNKGASEETDSEDEEWWPDCNSGGTVNPFRWRKKMT
ncbi:hypothetical protein TanjilG_24419 [Lupinus angustifolius]|uniref:Uncharacterized protein n=1 Tax=Lupinus angustifolius TaxID=3871 RepID=A0A1J7GUB7_LUPAN|nr:hypothetical protein TanjilG_24419 [Lupinus angustifolius]